VKAVAKKVTRNECCNNCIKSGGYFDVYKYEDNNDWFSGSPVFVNLCEYILVVIMSAVKLESNVSPTFAVLGIPDV